MMGGLLKKGLDEGLDLGREMFKKELILPEIGLKEDFAGE
jgi:hypothetical protein